MPEVKINVRGTEITYDPLGIYFFPDQNNSGRISEVILIDINSIVKVCSKRRYDWFLMTGIQNCSDYLEMDQEGRNVISKSKKINLDTNNIISRISGGCYITLDSMPQSEEDIFNGVRRTKKVLEQLVQI